MAYTRKKYAKEIKIIFFEKVVAIFPAMHYNAYCVTGCGSAWLERRLREAEVASSNPATPIQKEAQEPEQVS